MELYHVIFLCLLVPIMAKSINNINSSVETENTNLAQTFTEEIMTKAQTKTDRLLNSLDDYEFVVPVSVNHRGEFLGYEIYKNDGIKHRVKRSSLKSTSQSTHQLNRSKYLNQRIYYNITINNRVFLFNLTLNTKFVSSLYHTQYWNVNIGPKERQSSFKSCHYHGHINGQTSTSQVAISNCNGLFGVFSVADEQFYIQPLRNNTSVQVHVVYRQSNIKNESNQKCGHTAKTTAFDKTQLKRSYIDLLSNTNEHLNNNTQRNTKFKWKIRKRRSISEEKFVETVVVVDKKMVEYHGKEEIEPFVLSVMNVVAKLYHDASIGNSISIVVTRLILLLDDQEDLDITFHADQTLQSFCKWQQSINPAENSHDVLHNGIAHHDNAILLTRFDICSHRDEPCGTLGLAPVAGMCDPSRSCSVVEDIGLATSFTIAHEMGHNFGMQHDGAGNECGLPGGKPAKLMAYQLTKDTNPFQWSSCSRDYITAFLDSGRGKCLDNEPPVMDFEFPDEMPGQNRSPDTQCQWQYGSNSVMCKPHLMCRELYCINPNGECITNSIPAADGTPCSYKSQPNGWCLEGSCVERGFRAKVLDGKWSKWTAWGSCSRTCGGGVQSSERKCNDPRPRHGGKFCTGERKRYRSCNIHDCPLHTKDFRDMQCGKFDKIAFRGKYYKWKPYTGATMLKPCALNCLAEGFNFYTERAPKVVDGTPCYPDSLDVCINGECQKVGCDKILGSEAKEDKCRVCGGDNSSCRTVKGFIKKTTTNKTDTYKEVLIIPKGAINIHIKETTASMNYIAIRTADDNKYHINGHWTIDWPRKVHIASTLFHYKRSDRKEEKLYALGPISQGIVVMLLLQEDNLWIEYEYNIPIAPLQLATSKFGWKYTPWTQCSTKCASGERQSEVICVLQSNGSPVKEFNCQNIPKPETQNKTCNTEPCPPEWQVGDWSTCSETCNIGFKTRSTICIQKIGPGDERVLEETKCSLKKPKSKSKCYKQACPPRWATDEWSKCKPHCGAGTQTRNVYCITQDGQYQPDSRCDKLDKPRHKQQCQNRECVQSMWVTGTWEKCNIECGRGLQKRDIACLTETGDKSDDCDPWKRPYGVRECVGSCTPKSDEECLDEEKVSYCPLVVQFQFCRRAYFHHMCCRTCMDAGFSYYSL